MPPRGPPGAEVGTHQLLLGLLWHLVTCLKHSSFFRQSCLQRTSPSMRRWCCLPQRRNGPKKESSCSGKRSLSQNRLRKQEAGHVVQITKLEADAAKQQAMLQGVREQVEAVNDEVCALRALVADPTVPTGPALELPPCRLLAPLLLRRRRTFWTLFRLPIRRWKLLKMKMSGSRFAVLLIVIGVTKWV